VGAPLQLAVAELLALEHDRNRIRRRGRLRRKQLRQRRSRQRTLRRVPLLQDRMALRRRQNVQPANRNLGRRHRSFQQPHQPTPPPASPASASPLLRPNRSLAYPTPPLSPPGPPSALRSSAKLTDKSNFALAPATGSTLTLSPSSSSCAGALFCNANITWNSG